jgi:hypothetical protein
MKTTRATVLFDSCTESRNAVWLDCKVLDRPLLMDEQFLVPETRVSRTYSHKKEGFLLKADSNATNAAEVVAIEYVQSMRWKGGDEIASRTWRNNLDTTKKYRFPRTRERRLRSHPSHDDFDDKSEA